MRMYQRQIPWQESLQNAFSSGHSFSSPQTPCCSGAIVRHLLFAVTVLYCKLHPSECCFQRKVLCYRPIQKSGVVSIGIGTAGIERSVSTRRGVLTTLWHGADDPMMSGEGTVKLTDLLEVQLIDMPPKSLICGDGSNRFHVEQEWIQVNLTVPPWWCRRHNRLNQATAIVGQRSPPQPPSSRAAARLWGAAHAAAATGCPRTRAALWQSPAASPASCRRRP